MYTEIVDTISRPKDKVIFFHRLMKEFSTLCDKWPLDLLWLLVNTLSFDEQLGAKKYQILNQQIQQFVSRRFPDVWKSMEFVIHLDVDDLSRVEKFQMGSQWSNGGEDESGLPYPSRRAEESIAYLDEIMKHATKTTRPLYVYRGLKRQKLEQIEFGENPFHQSTSFSRFVAERYANNIVLFIKIPIGTPILCLSMMRSHNNLGMLNECEIVLPSKCSYRYISRESERQNMNRDALETNLSSLPSNNDDNFVFVYVELMLPQSNEMWTEGPRGGMYKIVDGRKRYKTSVVS